MPRAVILSGATPPHPCHPERSRFSGGAKDLNLIEPILPAQPQPRRGDRMQPTPQGVGTPTKKARKPRRGDRNAFESCDIPSGVILSVAAFQAERRISISSNPGTLPPQPQPRRGDRMQPTPQGVGTPPKAPQAPEGRQKRFRKLRHPKQLSSRAQPLPSIRVILSAAAFQAERRISISSNPAGMLRAQPQPRRGDRMQPTPQGVGTPTKKARKPRRGDRNAFESCDIPSSCHPERSRSPASVSS
jgi:hypothetical protein